MGRQPILGDEEAQQGDSGAGTINIVTRSVPESAILSFKIGASYKSGITGNSDFRWNGSSDRV